MKLSELIKQLQEIERERGDVSSNEVDRTGELDDSIQYILFKFRPVYADPLGYTY